MLYRITKQILTFYLATILAQSPFNREHAFWDVTRDPAKGPTGCPGSKVPVLQDVYCNDIHKSKSRPTPSSIIRSKLSSADSFDSIKYIHFRLTSSG